MASTLSNRRPARARTHSRTRVGALRRCRAAGRPPTTADPTRPLIRRILLAVALLLGAAASAAAQVVDPLAPERPWRTLETRHFDVHYPAEMAEWTLSVAARLDTIHTAVSRLVGNAPDRRITVVVVDPYNVSNGFAIPLLRTPTIGLWPTPPEPRTGIGEHRDWGELLAVHEYAHIAHLVWPSRNARERFLWSLLPAQLGPVSRRSPRWAIEGYATYIEGLLTGTGRPHGVWRPALLREWALQGRLPTYAQMSSWDAFQGGAMAYMMGSAYLEWLVEQRGEESLNQLWRRMSAVQRRSFSSAFAGVFGGPPDELYERFTVEITREALAAEQLLREAGLVEGEQFQRLQWNTGDPAVSRDGSRMAIVLRARGQPSRVVVWTTEAPGPLVTDEERERLLERDPEDVPAIPWRPRDKEAVATLRSVDGRGHDAPRFLADGRHVLVTRMEPIPDGRLRPDLFVWDSEGGGLRRVTRGAAIRHPDPAPDDRSAVAVRCEAGSCGLVRVDLASGAVTTLLPGAPDVVFHRPRYSPDGRQVAVAVQAEGRWRIGMTDDRGTPLRYIDPDDGYDRYDAAWLPAGDALLVVSHRGGVANLERIDLATGTALPVTRTTGAALAPAPNPADGSVFFLRMHTRGLDLNRLPSADPLLTAVVDLGARFPRVSPTPPETVPSPFPLAPLSPPRGYGIGTQTVRYLPAGAYGAEGGLGALALTGTDPIGRLSWVLTGAAGEPGTWRGGGLDAVWRGARPHLHGNLWWARQRPSAQRQLPAGAGLLDTEYAGGTVWTDAFRQASRGHQRARLGLSFGGLQRAEADAWQERRFAFAEVEATTRVGRTAWLQPSLSLSGSVGTTAGEEWRRGIAGLGLAAGRRSTGLSARATYGRLDGTVDPFERFAAGGDHPLVLNRVALPQRFALPALPLGTLQSDEILVLHGQFLTTGLAPFFWAASVDDGFRSWYRVVGAESTVRVGPASLAGIPAVRIRSGIGVPLDEPFRRRVQGYVSVGFEP
jgi:hypothetical protein